MDDVTNFGVAAANAGTMSWTLRVAGYAASPAHRAVAARHAIPATKRPTAAATVASVDRGLI